MARTSTAAMAPPAPQRLQDAVRTQHAHLGIALDGDADRLILVDETGEVVDGDEVLAMMAADMLQRGTLQHGHRRGHRDEQYRAGDRPA